MVGLRRGEDQGLSCGPNLVLAVMEEKLTDLTVTNEASPFAQLQVLFLSNSFPTSRLHPHSPSVFFRKALKSHLLHFNHEVFFHSFFTLTLLMFFIPVMLPVVIIKFQT